jgi:hypothetical protein
MIYRPCPRCGDDHTFSERRLGKVVCGHCGWWVMMGRLNGQTVILPGAHKGGNRAPEEYARPRVKNPQGRKWWR